MDLMNSSKKEQNQLAKLTKYTTKKTTNQQDQLPTSK